MPFALQWLQVAVKPIEIGDDRPADRKPRRLWRGATPRRVAGNRRHHGPGTRHGAWPRPVKLRLEPVPGPRRDRGVARRHGHPDRPVPDHRRPFPGRHRAFSGPARQILLAFAGARHAGLFLLAYWCLVQEGPLASWRWFRCWRLSPVSQVSSPTSAESVITLLVAAAAARPRLDFRGFLFLSLGVAVTLGVTIFWSSMKKDYRDFLDQGTQAQVVDQPLSARLGYLGQAADEFNGSQFQKGLQALVERESYIDILAATIEHVPDTVPFEHGHRLAGDRAQHARTAHLLSRQAPLRTIRGCRPLYRLAVRPSLPDLGQHQAGWASSTSTSARSAPSSARSSWA